MTRYYPGSTIPFNTLVKSNDVLVDPTTLTFQWKIGLYGTQYTITPTRNSVGNYTASVAVPPDAAGGNLYYRWDADGTYDIANEGALNIAESVFF